MKFVFSILAAAAMLLAGTGTVLAAPFKANNNPQIVANYPSGKHGIPGEPVLHQGSDVVMRAGNSGNFQQWFYGTSAENGGTTEGDHSVWKLSNGGQCPNNWSAMTVNQSNFWGDYLQDGATYCTHTNDFHQTQ